MIKEHIAKFNINTLYRKTVIILFGILSVYLLLLAGFSTSVMNNEEQTYLIRDNIVTNMLFAVLFSEAAILLSNSVKKAGAKIITCERRYMICKWTILLVFMILALVFVMMSRKLQNYDSMEIFKAAGEWHEGIFASMEPGGYVEAHDNNKGIVLFIYLISFVFGNGNYLAFQIINVVFLVLFYNSLVELGRMQGMTDTTAVMMTLGCILMLSLNLYVVFTYGVIISLSCMTNALLFVFRYLETGRSRYVFAAAFAAFAGVLAKQNSLILLLGILIYLAVRLISGPDRKNPLIILLSLSGVMLLTNPLVKLTTDTITKTATTGGIAMNAYIAMGFNENSYLYPGWYNVYVDDSYEKAGFSTDVQREDANRIIREKLKEYKDDPAYALDFFSRKNASQWNNPDFESVWIMQYRESANPDYPRSLRYLESAKGADLINRISNRLQFIILFGVMLFVFLKKEKNDPELYYCMVIIGGFVFHTFWEAKGQYILTYFVYMLPLAISGFSELLQLVKETRDVRKYRRLAVIMGALILACIITGTGLSESLNCIFNRREGTGRYYKYLEMQHNEEQ